MYSVKAEVSELFSSIQGEGIFVGAKQIFIRFRQCNIACAFCDEPCRHEPTVYTSAELIARVKDLDLNRGPHHSVSLTGGEPLMYVDFLKVFLKSLHKEGLQAYLETNGTMPARLAAVIDLVDIIAMDFKVPSSTGLRSYWDEHQEFLRIAAKKNVFVKVVVTPSSQATSEPRDRELIGPASGPYW